MKSETAQTVGGMLTAALLASGEIWVSVAAAVAGATVGLILEGEERPKEFVKSLLAVGAVSGFALGLGVIIAAMLSKADPLFGMLDVSAIPRAAWAFICGVFGKPLYRRLRRVPEEVKMPGGTT